MKIQIISCLQDNYSYLIIDKKNKWANTKVHGTSRNKKGDTFVKSNNNKTNVLDYGVRFNIWNKHHRRI